MMWQYLFESGTWSVGGLVIGYLVGKNLAEIRVRLDHIERLEERRAKERE